jgi:drug/metabolite transporter (DMT)-like permease
MSDSFFGAACALLAAVAWANAVIFFKRSGEKVAPLALNLFKNTVAITMLVATLAVMGEGFGEIAHFPAADFWILALSGFLGITLADTLFFYSLNLCGVGIKSIVDCLYSPFIILFSFILLAESLTLWQWAGALLVLYAVFISTKHPPPKDRTRRQLIAGITLGVIDMGLMGLGIVIAKPVVEEFPVIWATLIRLAAGTAALFVIILFMPQRRSLLAAFRPSKDWKFTLPGSVLGAYMACILWIAGFKYTSASVASILNQTSTIFAIVLASLILKEAFTRRKALAAALALAGIALVSLCGEPVAPSAPPLAGQPAFETGELQEPGAAEPAAPGNPPIK